MIYTLTGSGHLFQIFVVIDKKYISPGNWDFFSSLKKVSFSPCAFSVTAQEWNSLLTIHDLSSVELVLLSLWFCLLSSCLVVLHFYSFDASIMGIFYVFDVLFDSLEVMIFRTFAKFDKY